MVKVKLVESYSGVQIDLGMGNVLRKGDVLDVSSSYELSQAMSLGHVEEVKEESGGEKSEEVKEGKEIWVFAEQRNNKISRVVYELLGAARDLAGKLSVKVAAVLLCSSDSGKSKGLIAHGDDKVYVVEDEKLGSYLTESYTKVISDLINEYGPQIVLYGATHIGRDLGPRIAQRTSTGLTADCTGLDIDTDDTLIQTRPAFGGNIMAQIRCKTMPQMSTVRPGVMKMLDKDSGRDGETVKVKADVVDSRVKVIEILKSAKKNVNLEEAGIIIAGGRGLCQKESVDMLKELADLIGAEVGASRGVVDNGWIKKDHQVGQTGKTVRPKLYIACGISGAIQHRVGMENSDMIIAINKDAGAEIFKIADYGIVGDVKEVIPALIKEIKTEKPLNSSG